MSQPRISQVYAALNHVPTLCGIKREYFMGVCTVAMLLFLTTHGLLIALGVGFGLYAFVAAMSRNDPDYITLYLAARGLPDSYDPGKYTASKVTES